MRMTAIIATLAILLAAGAASWFAASHDGGPAPWLGTWNGPGSLDGSGSAHWAFADDRSFSLADPGRRLSVRGSWRGNADGSELRLTIEPLEEEMAGETVSELARRHAARAAAWPTGTLTWQVEERDGTLVLDGDAGRLTLRRR